ncbi:MAG: RNA polymerase sigma factor [Gammaproteobacteria bacterium]|nr:RNA polymerase sigma factor [Gammaproteobacteria bacterium]
MDEASPEDAAKLEDSLMRGAVAGDGAAMEQLYSLTASALFSYLRRLGSNHADADDLLQTTYLNAWRSRTRFRGIGARPWLFSIARNAFLTHVGKEARSSVDNSPPLALATPAENMAASDLSRRIDRALNELPADTREAVVLSRVSGLSISDIAGLLNTSEGNVRVKIHRGLTHLKEDIGL